MTELQADTVALAPDGPNVVRARAWLAEGREILLAESASSKPSRARPRSRVARRSDARRCAACRSSAARARSRGGDLPYRRRPRGTCCWSPAIEEARRRGCALVQLTSDKRRTDAHRFYERLGFVASHEGFKLAL